MPGLNEPILITGCARSGTSMTAGVFHICGAWGGELVGKTKYNPKGFFENGHLRQLIVKPFLRSIGADPLGQKPLPDMDLVKKEAEENNWHGQIARMIKKQGYRKGPWYYKGAKMCLIWPIIHKAFPDARWVIVRRDANEIVESCMKTSFMRKRTTREQWHEWVEEHLKRFLEMEQAGLKIKYVWPIDMIHGDFSTIKNAVQWAGLKWNQENVMDFIEPALWHSKER